MRHIVSAEAFYTVRLIKHKMNAVISLGASAKHVNGKIEKHNEEQLHKTDKLSTDINDIYFTSLDMYTNTLPSKPEISCK